MKGAIEYFRSNRKIVILTFELFWIAMFLLAAAQEEKASGIAQFVYVNF